LIKLAKYSPLTRS